MCGICGIIDKTIINNDQSRCRIVKMTDSLAHRGPDESGYFVDNSIAFGHRRLSIIDLASGQQPLYNENKSLVIIFNGEIYNYREIRNHLIKKGHIFTTNSDTETILHLYEEEGARCVEYLRGMFAFAIYDRLNASLFIARDRLGIKPLYYYHYNGAFLFGSEIKAILADSSNINRTIDNEAVSDYLTYGYIPAPRSIYKHIRKLPAGHTIVFKNNSCLIHPYWDISFANTEEKSENEWCDSILDMIKESVNIRLISEVPLGAFLSGGIDSSVVVATMASLMNEPVKTNSIGFNEKKFNELPYAEETAKLFRTNHREYIVNINFDRSILDNLAWYFDEPFADSSALPTWYISKMTHENVIVALSGDGGDENFAGYRRYFFDFIENRIRQYIPSIIRQTLISGLARVYPKADWLPQMFRAKTLLTNLSIDPAHAYFHSVTRMDSGMKKNLLNNDLQSQLKNYDSFDLFYDHYKRANTSDMLSRIQYTDIKTYLVDDILTKVDRASMAHSLEVRVPLLDHKFMELVASIPSQLKLKNRQGKYIFKKAAEKILPTSVIHRKKMGFSIPIDQWFRKDLRKIIEDELLIPSSKSMSYFNIEIIKHMWNEHQKGIRNYGDIFWMLLMFEKWACNFGETGIPARL